MIFVRRITMAEPFFSGKDRELIHREIELILDGSLSMGPNVKGFESEFADRIGSKYAIAMNSCTSTLEAALLAKGAAGAVAGCVSAGRVKPRTERRKCGRSPRSL